MQKLNHWRLFLDKNNHMDVISDVVEDFNNLVNTPEQDFDNVFICNGTTPINIERILDVIISKKDIIKFPDEINNEGTTIFGWYGEPDCSDHVFDAAHKLIDLFNLNPEKFYFINCVKNTPEIYNNYVIRCNTDKKITNFLFSSVWINYNDECFSYVSIPESNLCNKKLFISPNLTPRRHRLALIPLLNYYDLLDEGYVSSATAECDQFKYNHETDFSNHVYWTKILFSTDPELNNIVEKFYHSKNKLPLRIDSRTSFNIDASSVWYHPEHKIHFYRSCIDSLFYLITENIYDHVGFFSTEKTFIPISLGKPFLLIGSTNSLQGLKELGYKTFHPYINESYDSITDLSTRLKMIVLELDRLNVLRKSDPEKFYSNYKKIKEIAEFNQYFFKNNK